MRKVLLGLLLFTSCLRGGDWVERLHNGDYSGVKIGRYPYTTKTIRHPTDWDKLIGDLRKKIEENMGLLPIVTKQLFPGEESELIFKYKFTSLDESRNKLILRYFAPISSPKIFAGYQWQFVVDLKNRELEEILLSKVPLER